jgi:hypothetical protein
MKIREIRDIPDQVKGFAAIAILSLFLSITALVVAFGHGNR